MSNDRFVYATANSYGLDYVTEKVFYALQCGSVPAYLGAPNIDSFLPDRSAIIQVSDFDTPHKHWESTCKVFHEANLFS
jgi:hypothetical protein